MKFASLPNETRDGKLTLVSRDLKHAVDASDIAPTLQAALEDWDALTPKLQARYDELNEGKASGAFAFDQEKALSPLPRAYQWADGSAYINHVELVRKARGAEVPESFYDDPLMYQGGSDAFLTPRGDIPLGDEAWGCDFEAEIAVITGDAPMGISPEEAKDTIRLVMLVNDVSLRGLIPGELAKGFGFFQSKPPTAFSPVAVTPDELGGAWDGAALRRPLVSTYNGEKFGEPDAGTDITFDFARLVSHLAKTRPVTAGTIVGSGTISNKDPDGSPGRPVSEGGKGYSCIAEVRMVEKIQTGDFKTGFMKYGDTVSVDMFDDDGKSIFGTIENTVVKP